MKEKAQKRNHLKKEEIIDVFIMCEVELSKEHFDYIFACIINESEEISKLQYEKMFDVFEVGKPFPKCCIYNQQNMKALVKSENKNVNKKVLETQDDYNDLTETERIAMKKHDDMVASQDKDVYNGISQNRSQSNSIANNHSGIRLKNASQNNTNYNEISGEKLIQKTNNKNQENIIKDQDEPQQARDQRVASVQNNNSQMKNENSLQNLKGSGSPYSQNSQSKQNQDYDNIDEQNTQYNDYQYDNQQNYQQPEYEQDYNQDYNEQSDEQEDNEQSDQQDNNDESDEQDYRDQYRNDPLLESKGHPDDENMYYQDDENDEEYDEFNQHHELSQQDISDAHIEI